MLQKSYRMAKKNNGAPGIDAVTFEAIEEAGLEAFLEQIHSELISITYWPCGIEDKKIPRGNGKLILELIFEANFQEGSLGYRP